MMMYRSVSASALLVIALFAGNPTALAEQGRGDAGRWNNAPRTGWVDRERGDRGRGNYAREEERRQQNIPPRGGEGRGNNAREDERRSHSGPPRGYELDHRYHHDRYYPPRGHVVGGLPHGYRVVPYRGAPYYYYGGIWYRPYGPRFIVISPPIGLVVSVLPPFYTTIWVSGVPYYYADGVYYVWRPAERGYVVAEAPPQSAVTTLPATPDQLFIYPKSGQSEQQQATDRYECHRWAVGQTGFDPTQPVADLLASQIATKRTDYQRAMTACLEARGYSVK